MSIYVQMLGVLHGLAGGRVFALVADQGSETPYIVVQRVGGSPMNFLSGETVERRAHRVQVTVWAESALEAEALGAQVERAIVGTTVLQPEAVTAAVDTYDETTNYRGSRQDFSIFA